MPPLSFMANNIWIAASEGSIEAVRQLLDTEPNLVPTSPDSNTYTPLHAAASYGHIDLLRFLLTHEKAAPDAINIRDEEGDTPLFLVEDLATAKVLVEEFRADPKVVNTEGNTPAKAMWKSGWHQTSDYLRSLTGEKPFTYDDDGGDSGFEEKQRDIDDEKHDGRHTKSLVTALQEYSTCEISDALIKLKHPTGGHIPGIDVISPRLVDYKAITSHRICGQVFPVEMVAATDTSAPKPEAHYVDAAPRDSVMLITAPSNTRSAVWGGLMTARAQARGVKGVVLDGCCRDLAEHWQANMAIFARGHSTLGQSPFTRPSRLGEAVTIHTPHTPDGSSNARVDPPFPCLTVNSSDIVLADVDGVVIVPRSQVIEAVELAKKGREVDAKCLADLKKGRGVRETFKKHRSK